MQFLVPVVFQTPPIFKFTEVSTFIFTCLSEGTLYIFEKVRFFCHCLHPTLESWNS